MPFGHVRPIWVKNSDLLPTGVLGQAAAGGIGEIARVESGIVPGNKKAAPIDNLVEVAVRVGCRHQQIAPG